MFTTKRFIYRVSLFFSKIGLKVKEQVTQELIYNKLQQTVLSMVYVDEVNDLFIDYKYVCKRMNKINTMLQKPTKRMYFDEFFKMHKSSYEKYDNDYNIIVTNALYDSRKIFSIYHANDDNQSIERIYAKIKGSIVQIFSDSNFHGVKSGLNFSIYATKERKLIQMTIKSGKDGLYYVNKLKKSSFIFEKDKGDVKLYDSNISMTEEVSIISSDIVTSNLYVIIDISNYSIISC